MANLLISDAWAQAGGGGGSSLFSFLPLVLIFGLFYFLLIRPKQRRAKQHKEMVAAMKVGDELATNGGLLGRVTDLDEHHVTLEVATGVNFQVQRHAIAQMVPKGVFKELDSETKIQKSSRKKSRKFKELDDAKKEIEEKIEKISQKEDVDTIVEGEDDPSGRIDETQSDNTIYEHQSNDMPLWKQWVRNLFRRI